MDLLKTLLLYMAVLYSASVQTSPDVEAVLEAIATPIPESMITATPSPVPTPSPTPVPTIDISPNPDYKVYRVGDKGEAISLLQQTLAEYGYYTGSIDGKYGNQTRQAVERFQYCHGLVADGVAGKVTLTVLYDSHQVRPASTTPEPANTLTAAATPASQTAQPTYAPTPTPAATLTPPPVPTDTPAPTAAPTATPAPTFAPMTGWVIQIKGKELPVTVASKNARNEDVTLPVLPALYGDTLYIPLREILEANDVVIVPSDSLDQLGYAFAINADLYRLTYSETQEGKPVNLEIDKNGLPQLLKIRDIQKDGVSLYLPAESVTALTGITFQQDEAQSILTVAFPTPTNG